jgi:tRNA-binding protein
MFHDRRYGDAMAEAPTLDDFKALDLRVGTVLRVEPNSGARDPAYKLWIDVGGTETVQSSAKITDLYSAEELIGRQVVVATGFEPMRVGGFRSDALVIGALTMDGVVLISPDSPVPPGVAIE